MSALDRLMPDVVPPLMTLDRLDAWLVEQEDELIADLVAAADELLAPRVDRYVASLTAAGDPATLDGLMMAWMSTIDEAVAGKLAETWLAAATVSMVTSPAFGKIDEAAWVEVVNARAIDYQAAAANRIVGASESMWSDVRDRVVTNLSAGMEVPKLRAEVEAISGYARGRAEAIARTETVGAYNGGDWEGTMALPAEFRPTHKAWLATRDARTRPSHVEANGQVVPLDEPFNVGGVQMMRPHEPGAPAAEVVNCRCVTQMTWGDDDVAPVVTDAPADAEPELTPAEQSDELIARHLAGIAENVQEPINDRLAGTRAFALGDFDGDRELAKVTLTADDLRSYWATQPSVSARSVRELADSGLDLSTIHEDDEGYPAIFARVGARDVIVDGHHRALAAAERGEPITGYRLRERVILTTADKEMYGQPSFVRSLTAAAADDGDSTPSGVVIVAMPEGDGEVEYADGDRAPVHQTLVYLGRTDELLDGEAEYLFDVAESLAEWLAPFVAKVCGVATLGPDGDEVALTEATELQAAHDWLRADSTVAAMFNERNAHPTWISHITGAGLVFGDEVRFDRVAAWVGPDRAEFPLLTD